MINTSSLPNSNLPRIAIVGSGYWGRNLVRNFNALGSQNIIDAAIDLRIKKVLAISANNAADSINLYGTTKLFSNKQIIAGNSNVGRDETRFSVVRYGNVGSSGGSVIPFFLKNQLRFLI